MNIARWSDKGKEMLKKKFLRLLNKVCFQITSYDTLS
jgi:hypothetical protein